MVLKIHVFLCMYISATLVVSEPGVERGCWPFNVVPYRVEVGFTEKQQQFILKQIEQVHRETCVRWVDLTEHGLNASDYALFVKTEEHTCFTDEQRSGQIYEARITLSDVCFERAGVIHEMMHVMGFDHEHQRADRDCYVSVSQRWVKATGKEFQFDIKGQEEWLERFPYDRESVMHYFRTVRMKSKHERWYTFEPMGNFDSKLTVFDVWKIRYKFCNALHYCDIFPYVCEIMEKAEQPCRKPRAE